MKRKYEEDKNTESLGRSYRVKATGEVGWLEGVTFHADTPGDKRFILKFVTHGKFVRWDTYKEESIEPCA